MSNGTLFLDLPPLPSYALRVQPPVISPIPDKILVLILPIAAYWIVSLFFHCIDSYGYLARYRLHTPAEILKRNHVSRRDVVRDVVVQQIIQTIIGVLTGMAEPVETIGSESYDIARWARRIRLAQRGIPRLLSCLGINSLTLAQKLASFPQLAGVLSGGRYPNIYQEVLATGTEKFSVPNFARWELAAAQVLYFFIIPALQFVVAVCVVDTWQYFLHRAMHANQWLYRTFHSRHHRLYVPYAFGALYNHPFEGFLLDTLGAVLGYKLAGLTTRQGMWFFTCSTIKTVDDHCGYSLPWDPLQRLTSNNAGYHDIHHQSWGIKTNFSQPFFTVWDRWLGTMWTGGDVSARYERSRKVTQGPVSTIQNALTSEKPVSEPMSEAASATALSQEILEPRISTGKASKQANESRQQVLQDHENGGAQVLVEEAKEEKEAAKTLRRSTRRKLTSTAQSGSLKSLKNKVNGSLHGRGGTIIGLESSH